MTTDWKLPWDGGCRCDRVRLRVTEAPLVTMACHCAGCQRMSASAFSLSILVPSTGFTVTQGEPVIGGLHGASRHHHCPHCKAWMFTRPDGLEQFVNLRATMLDEHAWIAPFVETARAEGFPWASTGAAHTFAGMPQPADFGPILGDFVARGPRP